MKGGQSRRMVVWKKGRRNEGNAEKVPEELGKERVGNKCGKVKTRYFRKDEEERNVNENEEKKR